MTSVTVTIRPGGGAGYHYENLPMQYTEIFSAVEKMKISPEKKIIFFIFLLKKYIVGTR